MTTVDGTPSTPTIMRRPAVHASTLVRAELEHCFDVFIRTIATWWPLERVSAGRGRVRDVTVEPKAGGRVYETWDDGSTVDWGEISTWDPPAGFTMSWNSTPRPTEIELAFTAVGPGLTRVTIEHRGWERLSEEQLGEDCGAPGGYRAGAYDNGWRLVLERFAGALASATPVEITDEYMMEMRGRTREYTFVLLRQGPGYGAPGADKIIWEHGRRNFSLRAQGVLAIVCPVLDDTPVCGIGLFDASVEETVGIMDGDPGVVAGVFEYEVHPVRSFPGDRLPA